MALTFPTGTLTVGQSFTNAGITYIYDGVKWSAGTSTLVDTSSVQTITGAKTFNSIIAGSISGTAGGLSATLPVASGGTGRTTSNPKLIGSFTVATGDTNWWRVAMHSGDNQPAYAKFVIATGNHLNIEIVFSNGAGGDYGHVEVMVRGHYAYWTSYPAFIRYNPTGTNAPSYVEMQLPLTGGVANTFYVYELENFSLDGSWMTYPMATTNSSVDAGTKLQFFNNSGLLRRDGYLGNGYTKELTIAGSATAGQVLVANGTGVPTWTSNISAGGTVTATNIYGSTLACGTGSGSLGMTINDGSGNCNLTFNHFNGLPDCTTAPIAGVSSISSGRITCAVDGATAYMGFQLADSVTLGVAPAMTVPLALTTTGVTASVAFSGTTGAFTGTLGASDITTARTATPTTGYMYYGNTATKYAGFDGTNFVSSMPMSFNILGSSASCAGNAATATLAAKVSSPDGDRLSSTKLPTTSPRQVRFDFVGGAQVGSPGSNYAGLMTYAPWAGDTASTGDASYQLAFASSGVNGTGVPVLKIRKGIDSTWNSWYDVVTSASGVATSATTATNVSGGSVSATTGAFSGAVSGLSFSGDGSKLTGVGKVLQVVTVNKSNSFVGTSVVDNGGYFIDVTTFVATITPKSVTSKILIMTNMYIGLTTVNSGYQQAFRIKQSIGGVTTFPVLGDAEGGRPQASGRINMYLQSTYGMASFSGIHSASPNTISPVIYQIQLGGYSGSSVVYLNRSETWQMSAGNYDSVPVSTITLMEISA